MISPQSLAKSLLLLFSTAYIPALRADECRKLITCQQLEAFVTGPNISGCTDVELPGIECRLHSRSNSASLPSFERNIRDFKAGTLILGGDSFFSKPFLSPLFIQKADIGLLLIENDPFGSRGGLTIVSGRIGKLAFQYSDLLPVKLGSALTVEDSVGLEKFNSVRSLKAATALEKIDISRSLIRVAPLSMANSDVSDSLFMEGLDLSATKLDGTDLTGLRVWVPSNADGKKFKDFSSDISKIVWPTAIPPQALKVLTANRDQPVSQEMLQSLQGLKTVTMKGRNFNRNISFANLDVTGWNLSGSDLRTASFENAKGFKEMVKAGFLRDARLTGTRICAADLVATFSKSGLSPDMFPLYQADPVACGSGSQSVAQANSLGAKAIETVISDARRVGNSDRLKALVKAVWKLGLVPKVIAHLKSPDSARTFLEEMSRHWTPQNLANARVIAEDLCLAFDTAVATENIKWQAFLLSLSSWHGVGHAALADLAQGLRKNPSLSNQGFFLSDDSSCASHQAKSWSASLFLRQKTILNFWKKTPSSYPEVTGSALGVDSVPAGVLMLAFENCDAGNCSADWRERMDYLRYDPLLEMLAYLEWVAALNFKPAVDPDAGQVAAMRERIQTWDAFLEGFNKFGFIDAVVAAGVRGDASSTGKPFIDPASVPGSLPDTRLLGRDELASSTMFHLSLIFSERREHLMLNLAALLSNGWNSADQETLSPRLPLPFLEMLHQTLGLEVLFRGHLRTLVKSEALGQTMNNGATLAANSVLYSLRLKSLWQGPPTEQDYHRISIFAEALKKELPEPGETQDYFLNELSVIQHLTDAEILNGMFASLQPTSDGFYMQTAAGQEPLLDIQPDNNSLFYLWATDAANRSLYDDISAAGLTGLSVSLPIWMLSEELESLPTIVSRKAIAAFWLGFSETNTAHLLPPVPLTKSDALRLVGILSHDLPLQRYKQFFKGRNTAAFFKVFETYAWRLNYGQLVEDDNFATEYEAVRKGSLLGQKIKYSEFFGAVVQDLIDASVVR